MNIIFIIIGIFDLLSCFWMLFWENKNTFKWGFLFTWNLIFGLICIGWGLFENVILK